MVPVENFAFEEQGGEDCEDNQCDYLLDYFELHQTERAAVFHESHAVGGHLGAIFQEGDAPAEDDDAEQRPMAYHLGFLKLEMAIPGKRHKDVRDYQ